MPGVGVVRALRRLDDAVIPARWIDPERDPLKLGLRQIYTGAVFLLIGLVLAITVNIYVGLVIGIGNVLLGATHLSRVIRDREAQAGRSSGG